MSKRPRFVPVLLTISALAAASLAPTRFAWAAEPMPTAPAASAAAPGGDPGLAARLRAYPDERR